MGDLKPCPFCGSASVRPDSHSEEHWIRCQVCGACSPTMFSAGDAERTWNTRSGSQGVVDDAMVERAMDAFHEADGQYRIDGHKKARDMVDLQIKAVRVGMRAALLAAMGTKGDEP